jgi:hypothetical protein
MKTIGLGLAAALAVAMCIAVSGGCTEDQAPKGLGESCSSNAECGEIDYSPKCGAPFKCGGWDAGLWGTPKADQLYCDCRTFTCLPLQESDLSCHPQTFPDRDIGFSGC